MYHRIHRIEIQNPICVVERVSNGKQMDSKYTVIQSNGAHNFYWVSIVHTILPFVECCRGKRTQPKRLEEASMRDPSLICLREEK
jgi:hypothetical protein